MRRNHTPGPWKTVMAYGYRIKAANGQLVALVPTHCPLSSENPANAHLVAAAPELLQACSAVLNELDSRAEVDDRTRQLLRSAIAKATGQTILAGLWPTGQVQQIDSR